MKKILFLMLVISGVLLFVSPPARAVTINFDNIGTGDLYPLGPSIAPYFGILDGFKFGSEGGQVIGGVQLNRIDAINLTYYSFIGIPPHSGNFSLNNNCLGNAVVTEKDGNNFSFQSVYAVSQNRIGERSIVGYLDGVEVGSITFNLSNSWQQITENGNFSNIDKLVFELTYNGTYGSYFLDDLVLDAAVPVPEPGTMLLLGSGLVGLAGYGRRRFKK